MEGEWGGCWGWVGSQRRAIPSISTVREPCVFSKAQKQPQCTCQAKTIIGSSLTSYAALLVHHNGSSGLSWIYRVRNMLSVKADLAIFSPVIGVS